MSLVRGERLAPASAELPAPFSLRARRLLMISASDAERAKRWATDRLLTLIREKTGRSRTSPIGHEQAVAAR